MAGAIPLVTPCTEPQASLGTCGPASLIGTAVVQSGSGSAPFTNSGPVYLTGPYNGAPYGLSIAVPAVAGPFNLGTVVTRSTININPMTAQVTAESVLPTIVKGIPLRVRSISVDRQQAGLPVQPDQLPAGGDRNDADLDVRGRPDGPQLALPGRRLQHTRVLSRASRRRRAGNYSKDRRREP